MLALGNSVCHLYIARALNGITISVCFASIPMYIGEISSNKIRGKMTILLSISVKLGVLIIFFVGSVVTFRQMAWFSLLIPLVFLLSMKWLPESPYYLIGCNRDDEAFRILSKLRGHGYINDEFEQISSTVKNSSKHTVEFKHLLQKGANRKATMLLGILVFAQILSGSTAILAYSQTIFSKFGMTMQSSNITILFGVIQLITVIVVALLVDYVGRKPLLLISIGGTTICNFIVGTFFCVERFIVDINFLAWIPTAAIMGFIIFYNIGMSSALYAVIGEIFQKNLRAKAGAVLTISQGLCSFMVIKLFQVIGDGFGSDFVFFWFTLVGIISFPLIWYNLPETKGKSFNQILEELNQPKMHRSRK